MSIVEDYMSTAVQAIDQSLTIEQALKKFSDDGVRHIPVVNEANKVVGIISDRDKRNIELSMQIFEDKQIADQVNKAPVSDIMKRDVTCASADTELAEAARIMIDLKIGALPVLENEKLSGIISYTDILQAYADES